ncbi:hypothetical protein FH039_08625 [Thermococcus indicus]|uniref:Uncharacterized protein n=1 Tax=Thermococcus indicus TaxID=2586643 RepID=A0A4Y5SL92_9EURY|nr:hypothetical protein [Thermococcus indicus]QDA31648.1 hypothetical protein FH039_08625 [Thermococcus indicus]
MIKRFTNNKSPEGKSLKPSTHFRLKKFVIGIPGKALKSLKKGLKSPDSKARIRTINRAENALRNLIWFEEVPEGVSQNV